jgi:DNA-directed RNA polymerase specialized sigma subunit
VLELEAKRIAVEAMTDWLATAGMKPSSFIQTRIRQRLFRYVAEHQNVGRLPEAQVQRIGDFQMAVSDLSHRFGREPSTAELADHLSLPARQVTRLRKSLRPDILSSTEGMEDLEQLTTDADYQTAMLAYYSLNDQEKIVFDNTLGAHGCPKLKAGEIAAKLHVSPSRVSAIRESLAGKIR